MNWLNVSKTFVLSSENQCQMCFTYIHHRNHILCLQRLSRVDHAVSVYFVDILACKPTEDILSLSTKGLGWRSYPGTVILCLVGVPEAEISSGDRQTVREGLLQQNDKPFDQNLTRLSKLGQCKSTFSPNDFIDPQLWYERVIRLPPPSTCMYIDTAVN